MEEFGQRIFREHGEHSPWHDRWGPNSFRINYLIVQSWLKLPARSQKFESRTRNDVIPENFRWESSGCTFPIWFRSCQVSNLKALNISGPPFQQLALTPKHCHDPWSRLGIGLRLMQRWLQTVAITPTYPTEMKGKSMEIGLVPRHLLPDVTSSLLHPGPLWPPRASLLVSECQLPCSPVKLNKTMPSRLRNLASGTCDETHHYHPTPSTIIPSQLSRS